MFSEDTNPFVGSSGFTPGARHSQRWSLDLVTILFFTFAAYNAIELLILIIFTFREHKSNYFRSIVIAALGILPNIFGILFSYLGCAQAKGPSYVCQVLITIGWIAVVTGHSFVLWSRLYLVTQNQTLLRALLMMIIFDGVVMHTLTMIVSFGTNVHAGPTRHAFVRGYVIIEKIQVTIFFIQEVILSGIYIWRSFRILRTKLKEDHRRLIIQLLYFNTFIIWMDVALIGVNYADIYSPQPICNTLIYSIKLKIEFLILGRLINFVSSSAAKALASPSHSQSQRFGIPQAHQQANGVLHGSILTLPAGKRKGMLQYSSLPASQSCDDYQAVLTPNNNVESKPVLSSRRRSSAVY